MREKLFHKVWQKIKKKLWSFKNTCYINVGSGLGSTLCGITVVFILSNWNYVCCYFHDSLLADFYLFQVNNYMFRVDGEDGGEHCGVCSELTVKTPEWWLVSFLVVLNGALWDRHKSDHKNFCLKKFLYFSIFYHQNPKFCLIFCSYIYSLWHTIFSLIFLYFLSSLSWKIVPLIFIKSRPIFILIFSTFFITLSHQKITPIGIQYTLRKPDWSSKMAKKPPPFIPPPNFHHTIYHLSYTK